jgi:DNA polymerase-2
LNKNMVKPQAETNGTGPEGAGGVFRGFLVHSYADPRRDRLYFAGRLEDGRSFAAMESRWRPSLHIGETMVPRCGPLLGGLDYRIHGAALESFAGDEKLALLRFGRFEDRNAAVQILERAGIPSPDGDIKPADAFLAEHQIRRFLEIRGPSRPGRLVDLVFPDPELFPVDGADTLKGSLRIASVDIETDTGDGSIRAVGVAWAWGAELSPAAFAGTGGIVRVLGTPPEGTEPAPPEAEALVFHPDERSLLGAFIGDIHRGDPDILTGWNFLDFDFPRLAERCEALGLPFNLGRSRDASKYFAGEGRRSAAAVVPGRQVIDALRVVRSGPQRFPDYTLETVSREVLGEGKIVSSGGSDKIAELDRLYAEDPVRFGRYCYRDAELVLRIFAKTGLFRLTMERSALTGVSPDKAWTSVVSFERIYGMELRKRGIAPPPVSPELGVSGAAGGTVLDPLPGFFDNIAVFDFRSLYPTIMRTFNIDPLAHARAGPGSILAPNGAAFSPEPGALPELIAGYFTARRKALDAGDGIAAHVYKILMNSFYGVLGTGACRYGRTELAGAITSFARKWLLLSRDWFTQRGYPVIYGDTDSLFVKTGLSGGAAYADFAALCGGLAGEFNLFLRDRIEAEYQRESFIELRFEKAYRRFMIPPLRAFHEAGESRGRAKGYGGCLLDPGGGVSVEVKGMEAVRSDATPLARRLQLELLELVFSGGGEAELKAEVFALLKRLRSGQLDGELVYRKRLSRPPETYTSSTPPQVKAARALGWKGRRGTVEFVWTLTGPEPASLPHAPLDYDHYTDSQVLPLARSIAAAAGWSTELFPQKGKNRDALENGQMELEL